MRPVLAIAITGFLLAACATDARSDPGSNFVVVEENASIADRRDIRRTSILDDDTLLIETRGGDLYRVRVIGPCISIADVMTPARIEDTGMGVDRTTRFRVGQRTCNVRSITKVERAPRAPA